MTETADLTDEPVIIDGHAYEPLDSSDGAIEVPPGRYVVGDPCYSVPDAMWSPFLDVARENDGAHMEPFGATIDGHTVVACSTYAGDNGIGEDDRREYLVDSCMLGLVPVALMDREPTDDEHVVDLTEATTCSYEHEQGTIVFGTIRILTNPDPEPVYCGGCGRPSDYEELCTWGCGYGEDIDDDLDDED